MAITGKEKQAWWNIDIFLVNMNKFLGGDINGYSFGLVCRYCNWILSNMNEIIGIRGEGNLANKKPGVGVRGMMDILSKKNLLGKDVVNGENFDNFCECLKAISKLPRGGFLWIGSSALSKHTQDLCKEAEKNLSEKKEELEKAAKVLEAASKIGKVARGHVFRNKLRKLKEEEKRAEEAKKVENEANAQVANMFLQGHYDEAKKKKLLEEEKRRKEEEEKRKKEEEEKAEKLVRDRARLKELLNINFELGRTMNRPYGAPWPWEDVDKLDSLSLSEAVKLVERENSKLEKDAIKSYNELAKMIVLGAKERHSGKVGKKKSRIVFYSDEFPDNLKNAYTDVFKFGYMSNGKRDEYSVRLWKAKVFEFGDAKIDGEDVIKKMNEYKKLLGDKV